MFNEEVNDPNALSVLFDVPINNQPLYSQILENSIFIDRFNYGDIVREKNKMVQGSYTETGKLETKLVHLAFAQLRNDGDINKWLTFSLDLIRGLCKARRSDLTRVIHTLRDDIAKRAIYFFETENPGFYSKKNSVIIQVPLISGVALSSRYFSIKLNPDLKDWFMFDGSEYAEEKVEVLSSYDSPAATKLHYLFVSELNYSASHMSSEQMRFMTKMVKVSFDYLRSILGSGKKYKDTGDFVRRVLDPAITEINNKGYFKTCLWDNLGDVYKEELTEEEKEDIKATNKDIDGFLPYFKLKDSYSISQIVFQIKPTEKNTRLIQKEAIRLSKHEKTVPASTPVLPQVEPPTEKEQSSHRKQKKNKEDPSTEIMKEMLSLMQRQEERDIVRNEVFVSQMKELNAMKMQLSQKRSPQTVSDDDEVLF